MSPAEVGTLERTISDRLQLLMRERGITQQRLSYELETGPSQINRWVNGRNAMSAASIVMICDYFDVSADWLLGLSDRRARWQRRTAREVVDMVGEMADISRPPRRRRERGD